MRTENSGCSFENPVERTTVLPCPSQRKRRTIGFPSIVRLLLSHFVCRLPNRNVPRNFLIGRQRTGTRSLFHFFFIGKPECPKSSARIRAPCGRWRTARRARCWSGTCARTAPRCGNRGSRAVLRRKSSSSIPCPIEIHGSPLIRNL